MTKTTPSYLRIHRVAANSRTSRDERSASTIDQFWNAYTSATGWRVDARHYRKTGNVQLLPAITVDPMMTADDMIGLAAVTEADARSLAQLAFALTDDLKKSRRTVRRQATELAARAAAFGAAATDTASDASRLAKSIERMLADTALACGCDAGAIYLLDDDTRFLNLRFTHQLTSSAVGDEPRELRGSRGDLEAFVQGVVAIDRVTAGPIDTWNCPEPAEAAICASVNVDDLPIGTMWLFSDAPKSFTESETATARLAASHLARELSLATAAAERPKAKFNESIVRDIAEWQHRSLPHGTAIAEGWYLDGMIESPCDWSVGWHVWDVLPDGTILMAIAEAEDKSITGALVSTVARAALTAHAGYRHTPAQLIQRIGDTLWQTNTGDQLLSILCARINPETGEGEIASAGSLSAMIGCRYGYRPLATDPSDPLGTHIDSQCVVGSFHLTKNETLLAYGPGWSTDGASQQSIGESLRDGTRGLNSNPLAALRRAHAKRELTIERGAIAITRT